MKVSLLSIGSELLFGKTVNTNAAYLGNELAKMGILLSEVCTIGDERRAIASAVQRLKESCDFLLVTGGLGSTGDDHTKYVLAEIEGAVLKHYPEIEKKLREKFPITINFEEQATYPERALIFENTSGSAQGFVIGKCIALPGVPSQMKQLFNEGVAPFLQKKLQGRVYTHELYMLGKNELDVDPLLRELEKKHPGLEIGICPSIGYLSVYITGNNEESVAHAAQIIREEFEEDIYSENEASLSRVVQGKLIEKKKTVAVAESCTGGLLSSLLTENSGSSACFLGGFVTYTNDLKEQVLGVKKATIEQFGAVSKETAQEMASGVLQQTGSDIAIAITGIAGPDGGSGEKPVGTVWICMKEKNGNSEELLLTRFGDRETIRTRAVFAALGMMWRLVR